MSAASCVCAAATELVGRGADQYSMQHLPQIAADGRFWTRLFKCDGTGLLWREDLPPNYHGGGPARLRRISRERTIEEFGTGG